MVDVALGGADVEESFRGVDGEGGRGACGGEDECAEKIEWRVERPHLCVACVSEWCIKERGDKKKKEKTYFDGSII